MKALPQPSTLYTIAMSHYSEKIRWLLDIERAQYREVALTPLFHVRPALIKGLRGQTTVPVLQVGTRAVQDSTRIIEWLARDYGPLSTLPAALQADIMAVEERFDAIGKDVARYLYYTGFEHTDTILGMWTRFATPFEARVVRWAYPLIKAIFKVKLQINAAAAQRAEQRIDAAMKWLEERLAGGHTYLVGDQFTVADLTAASLLAPMACPLEHPVYGESEFRAKMASTQALWRDRPGLEWVRQMYAGHRGPVWVREPRAM
jgi:glutathione S-transferase